MSKMFDEENYIPKHSSATSESQKKDEAVDYVLPVIKEKKSEKKPKTSAYDEKYGDEASDFCFAQPYNKKKEKQWNFLI